MLLLDFFLFFFRLEIEQENYNPNWKYFVYDYNIYYQH